MQFTRRAALAGAAAVVATAVAPLERLAFAAAPVAGKQNSGWYRYKVGDYEVTVVTDGATTGALSDTYVANATKDAVNKALEAEFMAKDKAFQTYTPVVINTGSKLVAIDSGLGVGAFAQSKGAIGQYQTNLQAAGIDPKAIDVAIISHFHGDHINGLIGAENSLAFPNAEIMVPEVEAAFWADESAASRLPEIARGQVANVKRVFGIVGSKVTKYQAGKELVPGITSVATPGHTPGHMSFVVASGSSKVMVQGDVTAGMAKLFASNPEWQLVFDTDKDVAVQTRRKVYDMAAADRMMLQGYHFPFPAMVYVEKSGTGYRLVAAPWNPAV